MDHVYGAVIMTQVFARVHPKLMYKVHGVELK